MGIEELRKRIMELTKKKAEERYGEKDRFIIQAVSALEDLDSIFNLLVERTREWYGLHFPEINQIIKDHEEFLRIVSEIGPREEMDEESLRKIVGPKLARKVLEAAEKSIGGELEGKDLKMVQEYADLALEVREMRQSLRKYIESEMKKIAPNVAALAGPILGAKLMARVGGLKKLAMLPASTIQVIGAEKALFRHLTKGTKPPKHGILFQHPWVRGAKWWQRGKIARSLAAKIAIAAREDYFGGRDISEKLIKEMKERIKEVQEKYPEPPKRRKGKRK